MTVVVEIAGLELEGRHGALAAERESLQPFLYDVALELDEVSRSRQFELLESLAAALADALLERFPVDSATVRVRKPQVELGLPVDYTAASVRRERR